MQLTKYSSIENSYRDKFMDLIREEGKDGGEWVVTEKVHGGQFSIYYDGATIQASTRTTFLTEDTDFFNWQKVLADNRGKMIKLYDILKEKDDSIAVVTVYGELFGGSYPHPDVPKVKTAKRLQKGVFYHPDNLFYVFDIRVDGKYLGVDEADRLFEQAGFFYAKTLFRGSLEECIKHPDNFLSKISQWLGLPLIDDNIAEGIVIKPVDPRFIRTGDRVILKSKNEKFKERKAKKNRPRPQEEPLGEAALELLQELESLVTENRLQNVLSKKGDMPYPLPQDYFGQIMKDFSADIWDEFNKDFQDRYDGLDKKERKKVSKAMNQAAAKVVRLSLFSNKNK
jgi:Rnl2 family RNA ligase